MSRRTIQARTATAIYALAISLEPLSAGAVTIYNGSVDAGRVTYAANCVSCHGTPPNNLTRPIVMNGANNPGLISQTIQTNPPMQFLSFLSQTDIDNIAVYLAMPTTTDSDRIFNWGQATYPNALKPAAQSATALGYYYRFYSATNLYVGTKSSTVYLLDGNSGQLYTVGSMSTYLGFAINAGF